MSIIIETAVPGSAAALELLKEWTELRKTKKEEELQTPEWQQLEQAYIAHLKWRFQYPKWVFGQQILANWIITFVVLALVVCGIIFSFMQLHYALSVGDIASLSTTVEAEMAGKISISSSIVGAITLVISLFFFALYLKYVFQIKHTHPPHVSLSETDAESLLSRSRQQVSGKDEAEDVVITGVKRG